MIFTKERKKEIAKSLKENKLPNSDDDNVRIKSVIKKVLLDSEELIYALHNQTLEADEESDISDYFGKNIRDYLMIPEVQDIPIHYVCFKTDFEEFPTRNDKMKYMDVIFVIMCDNKDATDTATGIARHDLIGLILKSLFNWKNKFGFQCHCISDKESTTDTDYVTRTLVFELTTLNDITKNGKFINNRVG